MSIGSFLKNAVNDSIAGWQAFGEKVLNILGQNSARQQNAFNAEQAQQNRDFQERMSNTSWQRGLEDMQKAGLNSALAYSQGGASVPSGSTASASQGGQALLQLVGGVVGSVSSVAKAAIAANSARAVAQMNNAAKLDIASKARMSDFQNLGNGRFRTTTWLE